MCNIRHGINEHDFEARRQMPQLGQFSTQDPLKWDNPDVSPYLYCAANPIRFIDPTGCYITLAPNSTAKFYQDSRNAADYLIKHDSSDLINFLQNSQTQYYIEETDENSCFDYKTNTIYWNPERALLTNTVYTLTPAELLNHEFDHAVAYDKDSASTLQRLYTKDEQYGNVEERRVITGSERNTAIKIGRLQSDQETRTDHFGVPYKVDTPSSHEIDFVEITF